jgi:DNA modification methylase
MSQEAVGTQSDPDHDPDADDVSDWNQVVQGMNLDVLQKMEQNSVDAVVTSPPYWGLRDYDGADVTWPDGWEGQLGQEPDVDLFLDHLLMVFEAVRRVLKPTGALWVNIDDKYSNSVTGSQPSGADGRPSRDASEHADQGLDFAAPYKSRNAIPERFVVRMVQDGWVYRNDVVWNKSNAMPEAVKDRLARRWEHVYLFTPTADTWFDLDAIRQPHVESSQRRVQRNTSGQQKNPADGMPDDFQGGENDGLTAGSTDQWMHPNGKNPGDVWEFATASYSDAHFAVFPDDLPQRAIQATTPPKVCPQCGTPFERVTEPADPWSIEATGRPQAVRAVELAREHDLTTDHLEAIRARGLNDPGRKTEEAQTGTGRNTDDVERLAMEAKDALGGYYREFTATGEVPIGWEPGCDHDATASDAPAGTVIDPFGGAGTTGLVAKHLNRRWLTIEISDDYAQQARDRISGKMERTKQSRRRAERVQKQAQDAGQTQASLNTFQDTSTDADDDTDA